MNPRSLSTPAKLTYGLGELTLNAGAAAVSMVYAYFLLQEAGLRPVLAGLVPLIGRVVDAVTDPLMGRISDRIRWRAGRRRPFFLLGALPYGLSFVALWLDPPFTGPAARFAYYAVAYSGFSCMLTVVYVPYVSLLPEMARDYDARTSLNAFREAVGSLGMLAAISLRLVAEWLGGETADFAAAAALYGLLLSTPWLAVYAVTFEPARPPAPQAPEPFFGAFRDAARQRSFRLLCAIFLCGRMAADVAGALFILFAKFWLGRVDDFERVMVIFFAAILLSFPIAVRLARRREKALLFAAGAGVWIAASLIQYLLQPDSPRWIFFVVIPLITPGMALVTVLPWSMAGEVADEGELLTGERRDGVYNGILSFVRKLGGAVGLVLAFAILDVCGFAEGREVQSDAARQAVRAVSSLGPVVPLLVGAGIALRYPLRRAEHAQIRAALTRSRPEGPGSPRASSRS